MQSTRSTVVTQELVLDCLTSWVLELEVIASFPVATKSSLCVFINLLLTIFVMLSVSIKTPGRHSGFGSSMVPAGPVLPQTLRRNSWTMPYFWAPASPRPITLLGQEGFPAACLPGHGSAFHNDSTLPECSTTLKRLVKPSLRPLSTGLSRVVVERAQAEPFWDPLRLWRFHKLRSLEDVEEVSSLEEDVEILRVSLGEPNFGEQHGLSMRLCTFSRDEEICRERADENEVDGRDHAFPWKILVVGMGQSVCRPMLTDCAVCVPVLETPTVWLPVSLLHFLSRELERMACRTQLVISFMSSLRLPEISSPWNGAEMVRPSSRSLCCCESELNHCS